MEIRTLAGTSFDAIFEAFAQAFADYELQQDKDGLMAMLTRRGFDPELSFAAFEAGRIIAFTLNGTGIFNGLPTAYDTGTGTVAEYRGKGMASDIFEYSIPHLKKAGIRQYLLEVLQHNPKAISVYTKLRFTVSREFNYFKQEKSQVTNLTDRASDYSVRPISLELVRGLGSYSDFLPSWQNSLESVSRAGDRMICRGAFRDQELAGYSIFEPVSGDIAQIAVGHKHRRKGVGSLLLKDSICSITADSVKIINTEIECQSVTKFLESKNIAISGKQFEMIRPL